MAIDAVGQINSTNQAVQNNTISVEEFLNVFITQLNYQDPLNPVDNREFMAQMAQFSQLELERSSRDTLTELAQLTANSQSIGLIGKTVEAVFDDQKHVGEVTTLRFVQNTPLLTIKKEDGELVPDIKPSMISIVR
ncbi:flagellar hook assembly protein FlgD [Zooshikella sp. RANM57]|uniref:flagellar hook assembly protein FlgD n=1 Tax=Zooshikella sp. RANM57 TaxID=3425863 RepID=UPI003D6DE3CD